jgi:CHAD domain-containing protein/CYTH domain-containing protein
VKLDRDLLRGNARRVARVVAADLLAVVRAEHENLSPGGPPDAVHDFRVALRRLRSWLRAFRGQVDDTVSGKDRHRLGRIADATGAARDLEVHIAWVERFARKASRSARPGARWLLDELDGRKTRADADLQRALAADFDNTVGALGDALERYTAPVAKPPSPFAREHARLIRVHAADARTALADIYNIGDRVEAHRARIAAKRLRYLLEPLEDCIDAVASIVERLARLQDELGKLHDAQIFGDEIAQCLARARLAKTKDGRHAVAGLTAIGSRLHRDERTAFAALEKSWLRDRPVAIWTDVEAVAAELMDMAADGREIERKYLLRRMPADPPPGTVIVIDQGYLPGKRLVERLRREREGRRARYYRTVKTGSGLERTEIEERATKRLFEALWPLTEGRRVRKRRHRIEFDGRCWEIDEFLDRKLVLAEVELEDPDDVAALPDWLAPVVVREVTDEPRYSNARLAR